VRALVLGARSCLLSCAYITVSGPADWPAKAIQIIGKKLDITIAPTGVKSVKEINRQVLAN
jgi:L-lactate dehydrogenase (cytochrome)